MESKFVKDGKCIFCGNPLIIFGIKSHIVDHVKPNKFVKMECGSLKLTTNIDDSTINHTADGIIEMFPQLVFLIPINMKKFSSEIRNISRARYEWDFTILDGIVERNDEKGNQIIDTITKIDYNCVFCECPYDSKIPSVEIVIFHVTKCSWVK